MYAIIDIETTGSPVEKNGITDIAIIHYNGEKTEKKYETLINPHVAIPQYVEKLTGITNEMVAKAPDFNEVAGEIFEMLDGKIFVAHNADFDYSYVQHFLRNAGYDYSADVLCTLNLSRKAFPNIQKHGLENLCKELDITNSSRHRAMGDAYATTQILEKILKNGGRKLAASMIYQL
ncbi:MAG: 3'-5' exonuclease [Arachidicoccus sp.]|nr:3'-5' exonuclease [Arachidicoccus sp.]